MPYQYCVYRRIYSGRWCAVGYFDVDDALEKPVPESRYAFVQVPSCLVLGVGDGLDIDLRKCCADQGGKMLRELGLGSKGIFTPLDRG